MQSSSLVIHTTPDLRGGPLRPQYLIAGFTPAPGPSRCVCCRGDVESVVPVGQVVSDSFMNWDLLDSSGAGCCPACVSCLTHRPWRTYSLLATPTEVRLLRRGAVLPLLLDPPEPPFVVCVTRTMKKHNAFRSVLALDRRGFSVRAEDQIVIWRPAAVRPVAEALREGYVDHEIPKLVLELGLWTTTQIARIGAARWKRLESCLAPHRGAAWFTLAAYFTVRPADGATEKEIRHD